MTITTKLKANKGKSLYLENSCFIKYRETVVCPKYFQEKGIGNLAPTQVLCCSLLWGMLGVVRQLKKKILKN